MTTSFASIISFSKKLFLTKYG